MSRRIILANLAAVLLLACHLVTAQHQTVTSGPNDNNPAAPASSPGKSSSATPVSQSSVMSKPAEDVRVVSKAETVHVQIIQPSNLAHVFRAICAEQKLDCAGADTLAGYAVPTMGVDGTLREVIANLLSGTDINYRYTRGTISARAKLVLLGHAPKGSTEPVASSQEEAPRTAPLHSMPFPGPQAKRSAPEQDAAPANSPHGESGNGPRP